MRFYCRRGKTPGATFTFEPNSNKNNNWNGKKKFLRSKKIYTFRKRFKKQQHRNRLNSILFEFEIRLHTQDGINAMLTSGGWLTYSQEASMGALTEDQEWVATCTLPLQDKEKLLWFPSFPRTPRLWMLSFYTNSLFLPWDNTNEREGLCMPCPEREPRKPWQLKRK